MSPAGPRGKKRRKIPGSPAPRPGTPDEFDENVDLVEPNERSVPARRSKNEANKEMWSQGKKGLSDIWENYVQMLQRDFQKRSRESQEQLILRLSQVLTIGCVVVLLNFFYPFIPSLIRLFAFPLLLVASWFVATRAIAPMIVVRFEYILNPRESYEDEDA